MSSSLKTLNERKIFVLIKLHICKMCKKKVFLLKHTTCADQGGWGAVGVGGSWGGGHDLPWDSANI